MTRLERIVVVTLGLMGAGAIVGAVAGGVALAFSLLITQPGISVAGFVFGAYVGAQLGAITAPILAWMLLRRVPLGRMFLGCSTGTAVGGVVGWVTTTAGAAVLNGLAGAVIGCIAAAVALRYRTLPGGPTRLEAWRFASLK